MAAFPADPDRMNNFLYSEDAYAKCRIKKVTELINDYNREYTIPLNKGTHVIVRVCETNQIPISNEAKVKENSQMVPNDGNTIHTFNLIAYFDNENNICWLRDRSHIITEKDKNELLETFEMLHIDNLNHYRVGRVARGINPQYRYINNSLRF